jgi:radical SAM superfamily enzyme YgiQ (UPF0313 family)
MKILLCSVPHGSLEHTLTPQLPLNERNPKPPDMPVGVLRVQIWMEKNGYTSEIYDINNLRPSDEELIKNFKQVKPTVVGLSALLTHCYPNVKRISKILRELFPDIWIVVGGNLTASANVVLYKTEADICVVGDGEIPFLKLLDYFKSHPTNQQIDYSALYQIKGLALLDENNKFKITGYAEQLAASEIEFPDYDKLKPGLQKFGGNSELIHDFFEPIKNLQYKQAESSDNEYDRSDVERLLSKKVFTNEYVQAESSGEEINSYKKNLNNKIARIFSSIGCVARCTFCQRAHKGYSVYKSSFIENHIIELKKKYNVKCFQLIDENFGSNKKQSYEISQLMKKNDVFWFATGVRPSSVTYEDLKFYKEHNMIYIKFGIESGSQRMLDVMEKKYTTKDVYKAISNCKKIGLKTNPGSGYVIGMPGETRDTVVQTAEHMASISLMVGNNWIMNNPPFLAMAIPGSPLYEYCQQIGVIGKTLNEEEDYLIRTSRHRTVHILNYINKTNSNIKEVNYWVCLFPYAAKKAYVNLIINNNKSIKNKLLQIYKQCIRSEFNKLIADFREKKEFYKDKKLSQKMKWYTHLSTNFLLSLNVLFLPKTVSFLIIRMYANVKLYYINKIHRTNKDKQKYNLFADHDVGPTGNFRLTENRIAKTNRPIERSLRNIVMENRKQMKPAITDEEKWLQILAQGQ